MNTIYHYNIENSLGVVSCELLSSLSEKAEIVTYEKSIIIKTTSHICELLNIELKDDWLPKGMSTEQSHGWLWMIKKVNESDEILNIKCHINPTCEVSSSSDTGECLDAVAIKNDLKVMHIGTEDANVLYSRADVSQYMPNRFIQKYAKDRGIYLIDYLEYGFHTKIPELKENEVIYFQYLYTINTRKQAEDYPNEEDISTWLAVERDRNFLIKELGLKFDV